MSAATHTYRGHEVSMVALHDRDARVALVRLDGTLIDVKAADLEPILSEAAVAAEASTPEQQVVLGSTEGVRTGRLIANSGMVDEVDVRRNADGSVTLTILMGLADEGIDVGEWPTEGMGEVTLPAAVWAHLVGLGA